MKQALLDHVVLSVRLGLLVPGGLLDQQVHVEKSEILEKLDQLVLREALGFKDQLGLKELLDQLVHADLLGCRATLVQLDLQGLLDRLVPLAM